jgi:hypothetical protein
MKGARAHPAVPTPGAGRSEPRKNRLKIYELGEGVTQAQLRRHLGINSGDVSKRVNKPIDQGLVENIGHAKGRKGQALRITAWGRAVIGAPGWLPDSGQDLGLRRKPTRKIGDLRVPGLFLGSR